ncbi:hypothetical protein [Leucobacter denitrificans]|uniref:Uncharacterized protein n=1 Tax=Leucobacter denitrificans TaxID=683042 RepID=A0A7G9S214_9MICO|nr:hypothetical protein [Leucobacter denitrificans]QNN61889.1 hypothetical protein H9L06_06015 [Leucobacter denitrificans]
MNHILKVTKLHFNKPMVMFGVPSFIILIVLVVTALISFMLQRAGLDPSSPDYADGARWNQGMIWSLPGFLIYYGVQAVATTYPFALALGATRRAHVLGTAVANLVLSLYVSLFMLLLLGIELATNHWFFSVYALDIYMLGAGNPLVLFVTTFLLTFVSTSIGGMFGAVWVRFGSKGPTFVALGLALILVVLMLIFVPQFESIIAAVTRPLLAGVGLGVAVLALIATWWVMRRATVR